MGVLFFTRSLWGGASVCPRATGCLCGAAEPLCTVCYCCVCRVPCTSLMCLSTPACCLPGPGARRGRVDLHFDGQPAGNASDTAGYRSEGHRSAVDLSQPHIISTAPNASRVIARQAVPSTQVCPAPAVVVVSGLELYCVEMTPTFMVIEDVSMTLTTDD